MVSICQNQYNLVTTNKMYKTVEFKGTFATVHTILTKNHLK